jgi:hypothetical protein
MPENMTGVRPGDVSADTRSVSSVVLLNSGNVKTFVQVRVAEL